MSDDPTSYTDDDYLSLIKALHAALKVFPADRGKMTVRAEIEWAGENDGTRTVTFWQGDTVNTRPFRHLVNTAMDLLGLIPKPYTVARPNIPVTFQGQLNWLTGTKAGKAHAETAGFKPSPQTLRRWKNGTQKPSKRNQEALAEAGQRYHDQRVAEWEQRRDNADQKRSLAQNAFYHAAQRAGDAFTAEMERRGDRIRFFNIESLKFDH